MSDKKPMVLVFAGPNGSGKSTITEFFDIVGSYTNADEVVRTMHITNQEAAEYVDRLRYDAIKNEEDFTFETVLSSQYKIELLKKAKENGYFIKCIFVLTVDPYTNVARVKARAAAGGHDVEEATVISRYCKSLKNIRILMELCDILHIYDNTNEPMRIVRKHKDDISIFPNQFWNEEQLIDLIGF